MRTHSTLLLVLSSSALVLFAAAMSCGNPEPTPLDATGGAGGADGGQGGAAGQATGGTAGTATGGSPATGGTPGTGGSTSIQCGSAECAPKPILDYEVPPCCPSGTTNTCGLDTSGLALLGLSFSETCQELNQPGPADPSCPDSDPITVEGTVYTVTLEGCCRQETGTCGYLVNDLFLGLVQLGLGCVESEPFLDGASAPSCGGGGEGGAGGASGAGGEGGSAGSSSAGAAGTGGTG